MNNFDNFFLLFLAVVGSDSDSLGSA